MSNIASFLHSRSIFSGFFCPCLALEYFCTRHNLKSMEGLLWTIKLFASGGGISQFNLSLVTFWKCLRSHVHFSRAHLAASAVNVSRWHSLHVCHLSDYQHTAEGNMEVIAIQSLLEIEIPPSFFPCIFWKSPNTQIFIKCLTSSNWGSTKMM